MPRAIDITGHKYGRLTAISLVPNGRRREWIFACSCGNTVSVPQVMVRSGKTSSCGCLRRETTSALKSIDLVQEKFGRLLVVSRASDVNRHGSVQWDCLCDCGAKTTATTATLRRGSVRSCGCLRSEMMRELGRSSKQTNPVSMTPAYRRALRKKIRSDPTVAVANRVSRMLALGIAKVGAVKRGKTFEFLGYSPLELSQHIERQFTRGMRWDNRSEWEIDHIVPISSATCLDDIHALNQLHNLRPLWKKENNAKKNSRAFLL